MLEKLVSLIRFSFDTNPVESISKKIRHFYDMHFLMSDVDCAAFIQSDDFRKQFDALLVHDKELFDEPIGWQTKTIAESPLIKDFGKLWEQLKNTYKTELTALSYSAIPDEAEVSKSFKAIIQNIQ